jgi:hypothetical protein
MSHPTIVDVASRTMADKPKKWISKAIKPSHKGEFRAKAEAAGKSTSEFAKEHEHDSGKTGAQARLAETLMGMHHGKSKMYAKSRDKMKD